MLIKPKAEFWGMLRTEHKDREAVPTLTMQYYLTRSVLVAFKQKGERGKIATKAEQFFSPGLVYSYRAWAKSE
jgi:hypothetical protein